MFYALYVQLHSLVYIYSDGMRESNVVTKVFEVEYVAPPDLPLEDDDMEFREDLEKERTLVLMSHIYCKFRE